MMDFGANVLADVSNLGMHFVYPLTPHVHMCSCLLCGAHEQPLPSLPLNTGLTPLATPSDLDLVTTGSKCIRQLVVLGNNAESRISLRSFCAQLKTHLNYAVNFGLPTIDVNTPYQVLVFVLCEKNDAQSQIWFLEVISRHTKRAVVLCSSEDIEFLTKLNMPKVTLISFINLNKTLQSLVHGMMRTKHRLMGKDVNNVLAGFATVCTHQPGMCLFL